VVNIAILRCSKIRPEGDYPRVACTGGGGVSPARQGSAFSVTIWEAHSQSRYGEDIKSDAAEELSFTLSIRLLLD
jgi:hypothetical protein